MAYAQYERLTRRSWELFLCVAFIALITFVPIAAWIFSPSSHHGQARLTAARSALASIDAALAAFSTDTGRLPTIAEGIDALLAAPPGLANWHGPYLVRKPVDPWGRPYVYRILPNGETDVRSNGPDGKPGTADDVTEVSDGS